METCQARRGFLVLTTCGLPSATSCAQCGRPTCPVHLSPGSGLTTCLDCWAASGSHQVADDDDREFAYRYRHTYWNDHGGIDQFDDYDEASFDDGVNGDALTGDGDDDGEAASFGDS